MELVPGGRYALIAVSSRSHQGLLADPENQDGPDRRQKAAQGNAGAGDTGVEVLRFGV